MHDAFNYWYGYAPDFGYIPHGIAFGVQLEHDGWVFAALVPKHQRLVFGVAVRTIPNASKRCHACAVLPLVKAGLTIKTLWVWWGFFNHTVSLS